MPSHFDAITLENMIRECWAKVEWGYGRISCPRRCENAGWITYMSKDRQKSELDGFLDCIIIEFLHNPIATRRRSLGIAASKTKLEQGRLVSNESPFTELLKPDGCRAPPRSLHRAAGARDHQRLARASG